MFKWKGGGLGGVGGLDGGVESEMGKFEEEALTLPRVSSEISGTGPCERRCGIN